VVVISMERGVSHIGLDVPNAPLTVILVVVGAAVYFGLLVVISSDFRAVVVGNIPRSDTLSRFE